MSLDEGGKSRNYQTNNKTPGNDLTAGFYKYFLNEVASVVLLMFMTHGENLPSWVLVPEQESHLSYTKKEIKKTLQTTDPFHFWI